jgi:ABC-2 type transport system ATP-binding protein
MLEVKGLTKSYGPLLAADAVTFSLKPGDIFGFIGSNGAGKTTTIRMLATLLEPDAGTAVLNGYDLRRSPMEIRRQIGYMPDFFGLYEDVKVWEYLDYFATIYRVPAALRRETIANVLELVNLTGKRDAMAGSLSRGMQQRLALARCLVHDPSLLLLDEPASGLDPRARAELKDLIAELGHMGKIVIVSSHILPELADFCTSVGIIERGRMLACGPVEEIVREVQECRVLELRMLREAAEASMWLHGKEHVRSTTMTGPRTFRIEFAGGDDEQAELLAMLVKEGFPVLSLRETAANLEDVFLHVTTGAVN